MGVKVLRDLTEKSVNFSTLATSNIKLLLSFGEVDEQTKLVRTVKKIMINEENQENNNFLTNLPSESQMLSEDLR